MSYKNFETDKAKYVQIYDHHFDSLAQVFNKPRIESLDAIVLEYGGAEKEDISLIFGKVIKAVRKCDKDIPIFLTDVDLNIGGYITSIAVVGGQAATGVLLCREALKNFKRSKRTHSRREFLKGMGKAAIGGTLFSGLLGCALNAIWPAKTVPIVSEIKAVMDYCPPTQLIELRNAINARKIEEFIVPLLNGRIHRKPYLAIDYGAWHAGIETDLKNKGIRDNVLSAYKALGYIGINEEKLRVVYEHDAKKGTFVKYNVSSLF